MAAANERRTGDRDVGQRGHLPSNSSVSKNDLREKVRSARVQKPIALAQTHDDLPVPLVLVADRDNGAPNRKDDHERPEGRETHLGLADEAVATGREGRQPVAQGTGRREADQRATEDGEVRVTNRRCAEVVWPDYVSSRSASSSFEKAARGGCLRRREDEGLREVEDEEAARGEGYGERGPLDDREREKGPGRDNVPKERLLRACGVPK